MSIEDRESIIKLKDRREETIQLLIALFDRLEKDTADNCIDRIDRDKWRIIEEARYIALLTEDIKDLEEDYFFWED